MIEGVNVPQEPSLPAELREAYWAILAVDDAETAYKVGEYHDERYQCGDAARNCMFALAWYEHAFTIGSILLEELQAAGVTKATIGPLPARD